MMRDQFAGRSSAISVWGRTRVWLIAMVVLAIVGSQIARGDITYNDGAAHTINNSVFETVNVGPNTATSLNVVAPAHIIGDGETVSSSISILGGIVNLSGGTVVAINTPAGQPVVSSAIYFSNVGVGGTLNMSGGTVTAGSTSGPPGVSNAIEVNNSAAQITISGGLVTSGSTGTGDIDMNVGGTLTITGGTIQSNSNADAIFNRGVVNMYAGTIEAGGTEFLNQGGTFNLYGGTLTGTGSDEISNEIGTIDIYGRSFNYPFGPITATLGDLVGTLSNGSPIDATFSRANSAPIVLIDLVPEPASAMMIALGCGGLLVRRRLNRCGTAARTNQR
jgi:hypothetical protein